MTSPARVLRVLLKTVVWLFGLLIAGTLVLFAVNRLTDESPSPQSNALLASSISAIPDDQNIAVGLLGLAAPSGSDAQQYGAKVKALYDSNSPWEKVQEMVEGSTALRPTVNSEQIDCWIYDDAETSPDCLPFDTAPAVILKNKEFLDRFKALYSLKGYMASGPYFGKNYLIAQRLSLAEMRLGLQHHKYEDAYQKWRGHYMLIRKTLHGTDNWVGKAVGSVSMGLALPFLEQLLRADTTLASRHEKELLEILRPEGIASFNVDGIARSEYSLFHKYLMELPMGNSTWKYETLFFLARYTGQRNRLMNRYAAFYTDYSSALSLPWEQANQEFDRLLDKYHYSSNKDYLIDPFGSVFIDQQIASQLKARELLKSMHRLEGSLRLATLLVRITNEKIKDAAMESFLASVAPKLGDPFSGKPMQWDSKERKIYFPDPNNNCRASAFIQLPQENTQRGQSKAALPTVTNNLCVK